MKLTLRLFTVICYFLPSTFFFSNCTGLNLHTAYNQSEADENLLEENESAAAVVDTTTLGTHISDDTSKINYTDNGNKIKSDSDSLTKSIVTGDRILKQILMPTNTSLSGIGSIFFFKNMAGKITIAISLITSLSLLIAFRIMKSKKIKLYFLLTGLFSLTIFIVDSFVSKVTLLWGLWTLLAFMLFQLIHEFNDPTKADR